MGLDQDYTQRQKKEKQNVSATMDSTNWIVEEPSFIPALRLLLGHGGCYHQDYKQGIKGQISNIPHLPLYTQQSQLVPCCRLLQCTWNMRTCTNPPPVYWDPEVEKLSQV